MKFVLITIQITSTKVVDLFQNFNFFFLYGERITSIPCSISPGNICRNGWPRGLDRCKFPCDDPCLDSAFKVFARSRQMQQHFLPPDQSNRASQVYRAAERRFAERSHAAQRLWEQGAPFRRPFRRPFLPFLDRRGDAELRRANRSAARLRFRRRKRRNSRTKVPLLRSRPTLPRTQHAHAHGVPDPQAVSRQRSCEPADALTRGKRTRARRARTAAC